MYTFNSSNSLSVLVAVEVVVAAGQQMYLLTCSWWLCVEDLVILPLLLSIFLNP
jgi:hypothetical protein